MSASKSQAVTQTCRLLSCGLQAVCVWVQVSFEAPPGVKRNLQRTFEAWGPAFISRAAPLQAQLLFMLAWFHAIVQERRTYMPQASPLLCIAWNCHMLSSLQPEISVTSLICN